MSAAARSWVVSPHGALEELAPDLWRVEGDVPRTQLKRAMVVVRLPSGELLLHSAIALDDDGMRQLEALGSPRWLVVPNGWHRMDAARYKARYPDLQVLCPRGSRKRVERVVQVAQSYDELPALDPVAGDGDGRAAGFSLLAEDETVRFQYFDGSGGAEGAMLVRSGDGCTVVFGDFLFNLPHQPGLFWWFYGRLLGSTGGPRVTGLGRLMLGMTRMRGPYKRWLEWTAATEAPVRLVPGHGAVIREDAVGVLRMLAASL